MRVPRPEDSVSEPELQLLALFDALPDPDKHSVVREILHRLPGEGAIPDAGFDDLADELFASLDAEEATRAPGR